MATAKNTKSTETVPSFGELKPGDPIGIRHRYAGLLLGRYLGPGQFPASIEVETLTVWSWTGGRLEFHAVCARGVKAGDRCSARTVQTLALDGWIQIDRLTPESYQTVLAAVEYTP